MSINDKFDWLKSSNGERALLYKVIHDLDARGLTTWNSFLHTALGRKLGEDYEDNFRRGKNSRKDCVRIAALLATDFPQQASGLVQLLDPKSSESDWKRFLRGYRVEGCLAVVPQVDRASPILITPPGQTTFVQGEALFVQIDSPIAGEAICLRGWEGHWHLLSVSPATTVPVQIGRQWLTRNVQPDWSGTELSPLESSLASVFEREGTNEPEAIYFRSETAIVELAVIVASAATVAQIRKFFHRRYPIDQQYLDALPDVIRSSMSKWFVAWLMLDLRTDVSKFFPDR